MADTNTTIAALKPHIQRTPLTDKLLSKPPFRYLHDLVSELVGATGFGAGLFVGDETNAAAIKEKEQKIAWLAKIIKLTELATGTQVKAKPAKIIAGLEPEETNAWLQVLAAACAKGVDTREIVASLGGSPPPPTSVAPADSLAPPGSELVGAPTAPPTPAQPAEVEQAAAPAPSAAAPAKQATATEPKPASKTAAAPSAKSPTTKPSATSSSKDKDKDKKASSSSSRSAPSAGASRSSSTSKKPVAESALGSAVAAKSSTSSSRKPSSTASSSKDKEKSSSRDKLTSKTSKSRSNSTDQLATPAPSKPAASADPPAAVLAAPASAPEPIPSPAPPVGTTADTAPIMLMAASASPAPDASGNIDDDTAAAEQPAPGDANAATASGGSLGDLVARPIPGTARRERPTTARKAPPRPKQVAPEMGAEMGGVPGSAAGSAGAGAGGLAGARPGTASVVNVVAESAAPVPSAAASLGLGGGAGVAGVDDADDMFVVQRDESDLPAFGGIPMGAATAVPGEPVDLNAPHGGLVRKLLESKRAAAEEAAAPGLARPASGMRRATSGDDASGTGGGKDLAEDLQTRVQAVTRAAHPLGRTLDYLHEDTEAMNKELAQWRSESAKYRALLAKEREVTESKVRPLLDEMAKLDAAIVLEQERIAQAKARVLANEELVEKHVLGMVTPGV